MLDLVPRSGVEPGPRALGSWSISHWPTREAPRPFFVTVPTCVLLVFFNTITQPFHTLAQWFSNSIVTWMNVYYSCLEGLKKQISRSPILRVSFFFFNFLIGGNLLYNVVLVSVSQQRESAIIIHISPPCWASLPFPHPSSLDHHRAPGWAPCVTQQLLTSYLFCTW